MKKEKVIKRIPRPLGFTYSLSQIHKKQDIEDKRNQIWKMKERIIQLWTNDNMRLNGRSLSISGLSQYLNMESNSVMRIMNKEMIRISGWLDNKEGSMGFARAILGNGLKKCLEIMALTQSQTDILMAHQGNKYVPYASSEVNRSITNLINAQKPLQDYLKMFTDKVPDNPYVNTDKHSGNTGNQYLTPDQAMLLIENNLPPIDDEAYLNTKKLELGGLPDVGARNQDLSTIGIRLNKTIILPKSTKEVVQEGTLKDKKDGPKDLKGHHISRREKAEKIAQSDTLSAEDFIA